METRKFKIMKKPRSWAELQSHPDIFRIEDDRNLFKNSGQSEILILMNDHAFNPVTGEKGGGFYAGNLADAVSNFDWD